MSSYIEFLMQIVVCFLLSACIGIERQYRRRSVGLRTIILVSLGAFLFTRYSYSFPNSDMNRIASQVVAGIGFLGAGVIIKDGKAVKGLTTAATLWCSAAIGILCSANLLVEAITGTLFILFTNIILRTVNSKINHLSGNINYNLYNFSVIAEEHKEKEITRIIKDIVKENNSTITNLEINDTENGNIKIDLCVTVDSDNDNLSNEMMQRLLNKKEVIILINYYSFLQHLLIFLTYLPFSFSFLFKRHTRFHVCPIIIMIYFIFSYYLSINLNS